MRSWRFQSRAAAFFAVFTLIGLVIAVGTWASSPVDAQIPGQGDVPICAPFVESALTAVGQNCDGLGRNSACYGYNGVEGFFTQIVPVGFFDTPSERGEVELFRRIETHPLNLDNDLWGIALLNLQANLPQTLPGQSLVFMLVGDTEVENAVRAGNTFEGGTLVPVTTRMPASLYEMPNFEAELAANVPAGVTLDADAVNPNGEWVRVTYDGIPGWLARTVLDIPATPTLPVYGGNIRTSMQAFYFRTGIGSLGCVAAPSTLLVQSPRNISVNLNANGAEIQLGSTAFLNTHPADPATVMALFPNYDGRERVARLMQIATLDGEVIINPDSDNPIVVPEGQTAITCLAAPRNLGRDGQANDNVVIEGCGWVTRNLVFTDLEPLYLFEGFTLNYPITLPNFRPQQQVPEPTSEAGSSAPTNTPTSTHTPTPTNTLSPTPTIPGCPTVSFDIANGDVAGLIAAIDAANDETCFPGLNTITLAPNGTYSLTAINNDTNGANGLPTVTSAIAIEGRGSTISRSSATPFRIFHVSPSGSLKLNQVEVTNGSSPTQGGGIYNDGTLQIDNSSINNNFADMGGGIFTAGVFTALNTTIGDNSGDVGSGIRNAGTASLSFVTFRFNSTSTISNVGDFTIKNSVISNGTCSGDALTIQGVVIATSSVTCGGTFASTAMLGLLTDGTYTSVYPPLTGSPVIDAVTDCTTISGVLVTSDQNNAPRPAGIRCDAGAVEAPPPVLTNLSLDKSPDDQDIDSGDMATFTITVTNNGPNDATNIVVSDFLPSGVTYVSHSASQGTYDPFIGLWEFPSLAVGANATLEINVMVNAPAGSTITNTASILSFDQTETSPADNTDSANINVTSPTCLINNPISSTAELIDSINMANNEALCPGTDTLNLDSVVFALTAVNNVSAGVANGLPIITSSIILNGDASMTYPTIQRDGGNFRFFEVSSTGSLTLNEVLLNNGGGVGVSFGGAIFNQGTLTINRSIIQGSSSTNNGGAIFNANSAITTIDETTIRGSSAGGFGGAISNAIGTVTITNSTLSGNAANVVSNGGGAIFNAGTLTLVNVTISGNTSGSSGAALTNSGTANISFTTITNNIGPGGAALYAGNNINIKNSIVGNNANSDCGGASTITNQGGSYTDDATCTTLTMGTLVLQPLSDNGGWTQTHEILTSSAAFDSAMDCLAIGGATVTTDQRGVPRPSGAGCDSGAYERVVTPFEADVFITKTVNNPNPSVGSNIVFTVTVGNSGPDPANNVVVIDNLPAGVTYVSHVAAGGTTYDPGTGEWLIPTMDVGTPFVLTITTTVNAGVVGSGVTNFAFIQSLDENDPVPENNSDGANFTISEADIEVTKSADTTMPNEGDPVVFTIVVRNLGGQSATDVIVTDLLPTGLTYTGHATVTGTYTPGTGRWQLGNMFNGQVATLIINATVDVGTGGTSIDNTAFLESSQTTDPNGANNTDTVTLNIPVPVADLTLTMSVDDASPIQGQNIDYTITVTNLGPDNATGVIVTDMLPPEVAFVGASTTAGSYNAGTGEWIIGNLPSGNSEVLDIVVTVTAGTGTFINNMAAVTGNGTDPDPFNNNDAVEVIVVTPSANLIVNKTSENPAPVEGQNLNFFVTVANEVGGDDIPNVRVDDLLPVGVTYVSHFASGGSTYNPGTGIWDVGLLPSGTDRTLTIQVTVNMGTAGMFITNTATLNTSGYTETSPGDETSSETLEVQSACGSIPDPVMSVSELIDGIEKANDESCHPGQDTLNLSGIFTLTSVYESSTGLPLISSDIVINGGSSIIERDGGATAFHIFGVEATGVLTINNLTIRGGDDGGAGIGAAISNFGTTSLSSVIIQNNTSGIYNNIGAALNVEFSTFTGNGSQSIQNHGTANISHSAFHDNSSAFTGVAIFSANGSTLMLTNSAVYNNSGSYAIVIDTTGQATLINVTISGNANGGLASTSANVNVSFSTIASNTGSPGALGTITFKNSIVANNAAGSCSGAVTSVGGNYSVDPNCTGFTIVAEITLEALANNGGSTPNHLITSGQAPHDGAMDCLAISGAAVTSDQRANSRPQGGQCDAGAVEL